MALADGSFILVLHRTITGMFAVKTLPFKVGC